MMADREDILAVIARSHKPTDEEVASLLDVLKHPEKYLPADEIAEYRRCQQSVIDARRSAERNEGQRWIG